LLVDLQAHFEKVQSSIYPDNFNFHPTIFLSVRLRIPPTGYVFPAGDKRL